MTTEGGRLSGSWAPASWLARAVDAIGLLIERPAVAYAAIVVLQLKVFWGVWNTRDLAFGDTAAYFVRALGWLNEGTVDIAWSPVYTAFLGSFLHIANDPYFATVAHRVVIALTLSVLVLAVMRHLLSPTVAWLVAAWWATNPANYDAMYEVHTFAFAPVLLVIVLVGRSRSVALRAAGLAILAASSILLRNELAVSTACLFVLCWWWEARQLRDQRVAGTRRAAALRVVGVYALSLLLAAVVCGWFYERSIVKFPRLWQHLKPKHTVNMAQVYSYGYQQRHPEWTHSPWVEFAPLMEDHFGKSLPSLSEMLASNTSAVLDHFLWNLELTPSGLQLLLFNKCAGSVTPDYTESVHMDSRSALLLSILTMAVLAAALVRLQRSRRLRPLFLSEDKVMLWGSMVSMAIVMPVVILTQRPRPEYLYPLALPIMALVGASVDELARRHRGSSGMTRLLNCSVALILVIGSGGHFWSGSSSSTRPILERYRVLEPFRDLFAGQSGTGLVDTAAGELGSYLTGKAGRHCKMNDYTSLTPLLAESSLSGALDSLDVGVLYLTSPFPGTPPERLPALRDSLVAEGWFLAGLQQSGRAPWYLLVRKYSSAAEFRHWNAPQDIVPESSTEAVFRQEAVPDDGLLLHRDWGALEVTSSTRIRRLDDEATIIVTNPTGKHVVVDLDVEPGHNANGQPLLLQVLDAGDSVVATAMVQVRGIVTVRLALEAGRSKPFRLRVDAGGARTPEDDRTPGLVVYSVRWHEPP